MTVLPQVQLHFILCLRFVLLKMNQKRKTPSVCCVPCCKRERFDLTHKFPRDPARCLQWLDVIGCPKLRQIPMAKLSQVYQVCSRHFYVDDYKHIKSRGLNMTAIPSLNLKDLSELHFSKAWQLLEDRNQNSVVPELIGIDHCDIEIEPEYNTNADVAESNGTDIVTAYDCFEMVSIDNSVAKTSIDQTKVDMDDDDDKNLQMDTFSTYFEVSHPSYKNKLSLNSFWLRCHCRCSDCYDPFKRRVKISPTDICSSVQPKSVEQDDSLDVLILEWDDGHKSQFDVNFLFASQSINEESTLLRIPWHRQSDDIQQFTPMEFNALVCLNENIEAVFQNLSQHGVAIIQNIPDQTMAKLALCRLFPQMQNMHFEESNEEHSDICTNLTYSSADCGLKCFFLINEVDITLVDGLNIAYELKATNASAFKKLSTVKVPLEINDDNVKWEIKAPIIEINPETEEVIQLRLDVHRMGVLNTLPQIQVGLKEMIKFTKADDNQWVFTSKPGTMVILDNWRVFHKFSGSWGIFECYLERKDYISRMRHLGFA